MYHCEEILLVNTGIYVWTLLRQNTQFLYQEVKSDFSSKDVAINGIKLNQIGAKFNDQTTKYLGIYMDEHLTWKNHLDHINIKIPELFLL